MLQACLLYLPISFHAVDQDDNKALRTTLVILKSDLDKVRHAVSVTNPYKRCVTMCQEVKYYNITMEQLEENYVRKNDHLKADETGTSVVATATAV